MAEDLIKKIEQEVGRGERESAAFQNKNIEKEESFDVDFEERESPAETFLEDEKDKIKAGEGFSVSTSQSVVVKNKKNEREVKIEEVLSSGLDDIFLSLTPQKQEEFKIEGEKAVSKINVLLDKAKVNVEKIIIIIKKWLSIIPKVNRYFLEQEAKIKADQIIKLKK